jgi:hypothetical protein
MKTGKDSLWKNSKPTFKIEAQVRENYVKIDRLLGLMDFRYLTNVHTMLDQSCSIDVVEIFRTPDKSALGFFPEGGVVNSIWCGIDMQRTIEKGIIRPILFYDTDFPRNKYGPRLVFNLTDNRLKRISNGLTGFPKEQILNIYLQSRMEI